MGGSSVVRCPPSRSGRAAVARRRLRPRRCQSSATLLSGNRSRCRAPVSRLRTPPSLRFPFALGRAPRYALPSGSTLAPSPPNSLRSLRQQYSGVRGRFFCSGRAGSSYLAACSPCAGYRSRSACRDPPCGRHEAGRARPLHVAWRSRFGRVRLGLLVNGGSSAPVPPRLATLGATALCVPRRARLRPRRYRLRNAPSPCCV